MKTTLGPNADTVQRLRDAASKVAPNRATKPAEVRKDSAGTLLRKSKLASAEAARLLGR